MIWWIRSYIVAVIALISAGFYSGMVFAMLTTNVTAAYRGWEWAWEAPSIVYIGAIAVLILVAVYLLAKNTRPYPQVPPRPMPPRRHIDEAMTM